jgi:DNA-binding transcriptional regulator YiaG
MVIVKAMLLNNVKNTSEIRDLRGQLGLNQVEFAQLMGVHPVTVSKWERNEALPTPYQNALFDQFKQASRQEEVRETLKGLLVGAGVAMALALLLKHLMKK